jgi:unsaturated rhamnogalacturonyl hydrolase
MKPIKIFAIISLMLFGANVLAQKKTIKKESPLVLAKIIGNKLIKDTPFKYNLSVLKNNPVFNGLQQVNFQRTFGVNKPAIAYAYTSLNAPKAMEIEMQLAHNDGLKIWLNNELIYQFNGDKKINLEYDERNVELPEKCTLRLKAGINNLLVKSETKGLEWVFLMQPPSSKGAVAQFVYPKIGLTDVPYITNSISKISNWLVIGPFPNPENAGKREGLSTAYPPESELEFGKMYDGLNEKITWTIPKVEILGTLINPLPWGTNYQWNYHNGGVAWAMQLLAEATGEKKYDDYATNYGDFHLKGIPFVDYQVRTLYADSSANNQIINNKLLDFTLAPSLPLIYKLRKNSDFPNKELYANFVQKMMRYARYDQLRYPGKNVFTRTTPEKYTTWVDDMFMGIPFLVQASQYAKDKESKDFFMNDAANQVLEFKSQVWDADANLYMHAKFAQRETKLPHWSRANGWAIWAMSDVLMYLPKSHKNYNQILNQFKTHATSLAKFQNRRGFWPNLLDNPSAKDEVSGTAIFTMAMARGIRYGWLDKKTFEPIVLKGWNAIQSQIEPDGTVHNICMGTMCSEDPNYYLNRPFFDDDTHGLFAVLFAALEVNNMTNKTKK